MRKCWRLFVVEKITRKRSEFIYRKAKATMCAADDDEVGNNS